MQKHAVLMLFVIALCSCNKDLASRQDNPVSLENQKTQQVQQLAADRIINFSGINWLVREETGTSGPGDNYWSNSTSSVWVDAEGHLHMKLRKDAATNRWVCAEVTSQQNFGYGSYVWKVEGRVDQLDKNIVFGLFNYKAGEDGRHEVDIEFARWGNNAWPNFNYTVYPPYAYTVQEVGEAPKQKVDTSYELSLNGSYSTYRFNRTSQAVTYTSFHGHTENGGNAFYPWSTTSWPGFPVSTLALPVHMNLWLFDHLAPSNNQEVELIIHSFAFTAQ
jgi:hypothetical protein